MIIFRLKSKYEMGLKRFSLTKSVCALGYDEAMMGHANLDEPSHPEQPLRVKRIFEKHKEFGLLQRVKHVESRKATGISKLYFLLTQSFSNMHHTVSEDQCHTPSK